MSGRISWQEWSQRVFSRARLRPPMLVASGLTAVVAVAATSLSFGWLSSQPAALVDRASAAPTTRASVLVLGARSGYVDWHAPLVVDVLHGTARSVTVTSNGRPVPGAFNAVAWVSRHALLPLHRYDITVSYADASGHAYTQRMSVRARDSSHHNNVTLSPDGQVVGVGQPVIATFSHSVPSHLRALVTRRLTVGTTPAVGGAWHWMSSTEAHWRPPTYWRPGTEVRV